MLALFAVLLALGDAAHVINNKEEAHFVVAKRPKKPRPLVEQMRDMFKNSSSIALSRMITRTPRRPPLPDANGARTTYLVNVVEDQRRRIASTEGGRRRL